MKLKVPCGVNSLLQEVEEIDEAISGSESGGWKADTGVGYSKESGNLK